MITSTYTDFFSLVYGPTAKHDSKQEPTKEGLESAIKVLQDKLKEVDSKIYLDSEKYSRMKERAEKLFESPLACHKDKYYFINKDFVSGKHYIDLSDPVSEFKYKASCWVDGMYAEVLEDTDCGGMGLNVHIIYTV